VIGMKRFLFILMASIFLFACGKSKPEVLETDKLSELTDSVIYEDLKFGITRSTLLKRFSDTPQQNIMSEPLFDTNVVEVEDAIDINGHHFIVYHYFDIHDSLYRVRAEYRAENPDKYEDAARTVAKILYVHYGVPKKWKTVINSYKFSWDLKNKQIFLEMGCFITNCIVEVSVTELRLFIKNRDRVIPG
jgi:hypothetical protein